jgi:membrane-associated protease RseP (regulator of RpoE activity)
MSTDSIPDVTTAQPRAREMRSIGLPVVLFVLTCYTTYSTPGGLPFALALMTTLLAHEFGHFLQSVRYSVPASLPLFIPMPYSPIGTMGAVIVMQPGKGDRSAIFDIAITGPLAGLFFALLFSVIGLRLSEVVPFNQPSRLHLGAPLLFKGLAYLTLGSTTHIALHPIAFAGWVGIFITALNLIPIGQLDGGHILYALLRQKAHIVAQLLLLGAIAAVFIGRYWGWSLMLILLMLIGPIHPPTANDNVPLGTTRTVLGWVSLMFVIIGFTPTPFIG